MGVRWLLSSWFFSSTEIDFLVFLVTFVGCLVLGQDLGIIIGITLNLCIILLSSAKPDIDIHTEEAILIVIPKGHLTYSSAEHFRNTITKKLFQGSIDKVVIDGRNISSIDSSIAFALSEMIRDLEQSKCLLVLESWEPNTFGVLCRMDPKFKDFLEIEKPTV